MKTSWLLVLGVLMPSAAFAGSDSRECQTTDKRIVMDTSSRKVTIQLVGPGGKKSTFEHLVSIMPDYDITVAQSDDDIVAVPITPEKMITADRKQLHVTKKDGKSCDGREFWDDHSVQSYVLMAKGGAQVDRLFSGMTVKGLLSTGYIVAEFQCTHTVVTSAGGCRVEEGDDQEMRSIKPSR
jgi:hypothetical protein